MEQIGERVRIADSIETHLAIRSYLTTALFFAVGVGRPGEPTPYQRAAREAIAERLPREFDAIDRIDAAMMDLLDAENSMAVYSMLIGPRNLHGREHAPDRDAAGEFSSVEMQLILGQDQAAEQFEYGAMAIDPLLGKGLEDIASTAHEIFELGRGNVMTPRVWNTYVGDAARWTARAAWASVQRDPHSHPEWHEALQTDSATPGLLAKYVRASVATTLFSPIAAAVDAQLVDTTFLDFIDHADAVAKLTRVDPGSELLLTLA